MFLRQKKTTAVGLLLLVAIPLVFSVVVLVKQKIIHYLREERFDTELLQTITVSPEEFHWVKQGKEIMIDGKLFDVESYKTECDKVLLTGFFDNKEDKLVSHMTELAQQKDESNSPFSQQILKFLFSPACTNHLKITYGGNWKFISQQYYPFDEMIPDASSHSISPPPRS